MDHGLSQYEARERLLWLVFLLLCLLMALPALWIHLAGVPRTPVIATTSEALKSYGFWSQRHWMHVGPLGKLLAYLASNHHRVLTHQSILSHVWGPEDADHTEYLRVYMRQLRKKLEADPDRPRHILTEPGIGYRFIADE